MTGRLIEEQAVLDLAHDIVIGDYRHRCIDPSAVRELPTVDAIPVIRCKDCIWFTGEQKYCSNDHWTPTGDGYCNFAQRKEE